MNETQHDIATIVAQTSSLLYRGFPIRRRHLRSKPLAVAASCRLEVGDTPGWKPALRSLAIGCWLLAISPAAQAHPGHSLSDVNTSHLLSSPDHLTMLALGGAGLLLASRFIQRRAPRWLIRGLGVIALFAAALLWQASG